MHDSTSAAESSPNAAFRSPDGDGRPDFSA